MPELPEVETMCRGIAPIVGQRVLAAERVACRRRPIVIEPRIDQFRRRAEGKFVTGIERVGKRVVIWLGDKTGTKFLPRARQAQGLQPLGLTHNLSDLSTGSEAII